MPKVNPKCIECSKVNWRLKVNKEPGCFMPDRCKKKRAYYRNIEHYRAKLRQYHRYIKFLDNKCLVCGLTDSLEVHHLKAQCLGGDDTPINTVTLCKACHKVITIYNRRLGLERKLIDS